MDEIEQPDGRDPVERISDELGICRECGSDLPEELLRYSIDYCETCAGFCGATLWDLDDLFGCDRPAGHQGWHFDSLAIRAWPFTWEEVAP